MFTKLACVSLLAASVLAAPHGSNKRHPAVEVASNSTSALSKRANHGKVTWYGPEESDPRLLCEPYFYSDPNVQIVALAYPSLINNANKDQFCGRYITVEYQGKTVQAQIQDGCASCTDNNWIDLSPGAISVLDPNYRQTGQFMVNWYYSDDAPKPEPSPEPSPEPTSTWTPPPEPTSTYTPPPTSTYTETSTSTAAPQSSTSAIPSLSSALMSSAVPTSSGLASSFMSLNASMTASINASITGNSSLSASATASANGTAASSVMTVSLHNSTQTTIAPDAVITTDGDASGNLAGLNNLIASIGRIIVAGASL